MKKTLGLLSVIFMILAIAGASSATLSTISDDIFFDPINNRYWYDNPGAFQNTSLTEQLDQINSLSLQVGDDLYDNWIMAYQNDVSAMVNSNSVGTNWLDVFDGLWILENLGDNRDWSLYGRAQSSPSANGSDVRLRVDDLGGDWALAYSTYSGSIGAWVRHDGSPSPVSEPVTMLLFGSGLLGLAGFGRKKFSKR